tara:strand:+ start:4340 stop:5617 length:1278 start_codon:yes stop_codon:yes gene_type:complete
MPNKTLFVGNVLPPTGENIEGDPTFDFNTKESSEMDLKGVPIRIEHEPGLAVGHVKKSWVESNGQKWIMGELDNNTLESSYANHAIVPDSKGNTLYKGLSLQHVHTQYSNGNSSKKPVEISICTEPRRPDCFIRAVSKRKKNDYIAHKASILSKPMSDTNQTQQNIQSEITTPQTSNVAPPVVQQQQSIDNQQSSSNAPVETSSSAPPMDRDKLMSLVMEQEKELQEKLAAHTALQAKYEKMESEIKKERDAERTRTVGKAEALSKALVESWERSLPNDVMTDENKQAIYALATKFPQESVKMMEIAHKASAKHRRTEEDLERERANTERKILEQQVAGVIQKRSRPLMEPTHASITHAASKRRRMDVPVVAQQVFNPFATSTTISKSASSIKESSPHLFNALSNFNSGNAKSHMDNLFNYRNGL